MDLELGEDSLIHFAAVVTALAAVVTGAGVIVKKVVLPLGKGIAALGRTAHALDVVADLSPALQQVVKELGPNGGKSLMDRVEKLETDHGVLADYIAEGREAHAKIVIQLDNIQQQLENGLTS